MKEVAISEFKAKCLGMLEEVRKTGVPQATIIRETRRVMIATSMTVYISVLVDCLLAEAFSELAGDGANIPQPTKPKHLIVRSSVADMT